MRSLPGGRAHPTGRLATHNDEQRDDHELVDGGMLPIHERWAHGRVVIACAHWKVRRADLDSERVHAVLRPVAAHRALRTGDTSDTLLELFL
jgi:hypothetical protein